MSNVIQAPCGLNLDSETFEVEGQVVKGKSGGSGGEFIVNLIIDGENYSIDKTFAEIGEAFAKHITVKMYIPDSGYPAYIPLLNYYEEDGWSEFGGALHFSLTGTKPKIIAATVEVNDDESVNYTKGQIFGTSS